MTVDQKRIINIDANLDTALMLAADLFYSDKIFIYPTDTIYGIGGNPFDVKVVSRISEIKGRDEKKQFIWLLPDIEKVINYTEILFENHLEFLQKIWPAQLTVILNLNERTKNITSQETAAIRIPKDEFCIKLLKEISRPLISTSVNHSGEKPVNQAEKIINDFSQSVDAVFIKSQITTQISSTIIDLTSKKPKLIREGYIKFVELLQNLS